MIGYLVDFIQNNIFMIIAIAVVVVFLSLAFKHFRRVMYGGIIAGSLSLILAVIHKVVGNGLESFYAMFQRVFYTVTRYISLAQEQLIQNRSILSLVVTLLESDELLKSVLTNKITLNLFVNLAKTDFKLFINNINISVQNASANIKQVFARRINRSSLAFVYRC